MALMKSYRDCCLSQTMRSRSFARPARRLSPITSHALQTMAEVAAARQLIRAAGKGDDLADPAVLGPGSGLLPVFWSEALAVQSAGGKQRKVASPPLAKSAAYTLRMAAVATASQRDACRL